MLPPETGVGSTAMLFLSELDGANGAARPWITFVWQPGGLYPGGCKPSQVARPLRRLPEILPESENLTQTPRNSQIPFAELVQRSQPRICRLVEMSVLTRYN